MAEQKLFKVAGNIITVGPSTNFPQRMHYQHLRIRDSGGHDHIVHDVGADKKISLFLTRGKDVTLYFVPSPTGEKYIFAIEADGAHVDVIDAIGEGQAKAFKSAIKWLLLSIPLCLLIVGFILFPLTIRAIILLSRAPKPAEMRAFMAAEHAVA